MANAGYQVVQERGQQTPHHELGQGAGQTRLHLLEAFLGRQGQVECVQQHSDAQEQNDAGDTVSDGRVSSDWELDGPKV